MVKEYGLENEKLAGNKRRKGMPLVLDDRLISKQYIKEKTDAKVDNTAFASSWNGVEDVAPSKDAVFDKINSFVNVSDVWTKKDDDASDSNVRANKTGKYSIGHANFTDDSTWEKLNLVGSFPIETKSKILSLYISSYCIIHQPPCIVLWQMLLIFVYLF